jgi:LmbE family N-acetylglucosaminyl deacetylase
MSGWMPHALPQGRYVVVAPHPDDEILAAGGLLRWAAWRRRAAIVVGVTDGEASHAGSTVITPDELRRRRASERLAALACLGASSVPVIRLGIPDQGCAGRIDDIAAALRRVLRPGDVVVAPPSCDRHPDHVAVSDATMLAGRDVVAEVWQAPTWALVHGTAEAADCRLTLGQRAWTAKQAAMMAHRSQLHPLGPHPEDGPVVHPHELAAMLRPVEQFRAVPTG